jgi:hypothetical protein
MDLAEHSSGYNHRNGDARFSIFTMCPIFFVRLPKSFFYVDLSHRHYIDSVAEPYYFDETIAP